MHNIMNEYQKLVEFLGHIVGNNCEIVLQDLRKGKNCITTIVNGHVSGRKIGSPLTNLAAKVASEGIWKDKDFYVNYEGLTEDNKTLRSSTFFIKENGNLLGMLCFNIDDSKYIELSKLLLSTAGVPIPADEAAYSSSPSEMENFYKDAEDVTDSIMEDFSKNRPLVPMDRLNQEEKIAIVKALEEKGVFLVKGTVSKVAKKLQISDASLYRYLSKIQKEKGPISK